MRNSKKIKRFIFIILALYVFVISYFIIYPVIIDTLTIINSVEDLENVFINSRIRSFGNIWRISADKGRGRRVRRINLDKAQLEAFSVMSSSEEGVILLRIYQCEHIKKIDISNFQGTLDMSGFTPGVVYAELIFKNTISFSIVLDW